MNKKRLNPGYLLGFGILLAVEVIIALFVRDRFVRPYLGDVLAVMVVYCGLRVFLPYRRLLPLWVFLFAACLEITQYFHLAGMLGLDRTHPLAILLGGTFDWADMACYGAGCLLLALWQRVEQRRRAL